MQKHILVIILSISCLSVFSQKRQNVYYIKNGIPIKDKELADYRRIIQEPDSGSTLYNLLEFYPDNTEKTIGKISKFDPSLIYEGEIKFFNKKGMLIQESNYVKGKLVGDSRFYYDNGVLKKLLIYSKTSTENPKNQVNIKMMTYSDSLGNQSIKDGNGFYREVNKNDFDEGNYVLGNKEGIWKGKFRNATYEDLYKNGLFISGEVILENGKKMKYTVMDEAPSFPGGIERFYQYLGRELSFPKEAFAEGSKGRLYITFNIEKDGQLSDISFKNSLSEAVEREVLRVFRNSLRWSPGTMHGIPVKVKYNISINLK